LKIIKLLIKELAPINDNSALQQGLSHGGGSVADSDDEWEDELEDLDFAGSKKGRGYRRISAVFSANNANLLYL